MIAVSANAGVTSPGASGPSALLQRHRWAIGGAALSVLVIALVLLASLPTGADSAARAVPEGARLATSATVGEVEVQVLSSHGALSVQVAYEGPKGWLAAALPAPPADGVVMWTGTRGQGPVPAFTAVHGRVPGVSVVVEWADGRRDTVETTSDGVFVAVRDRLLGASSIRVLDEAGTIVLEIGEL